MKILRRFLLFIFLTTITQIGGVIYLLSIWICNKWKRTFRGKFVFVFFTIYLLSTFLIVPVLAKFSGREKVIHTSKVQPTNYATVLLNRNYVKPELNKVLLSTAKNLKNSKFKIKYLDANFPFINQFPLLPHLSHKDGKKLDLSLIYEDENGVISDSKKSISGYGVFEAPKSKELNQPKNCLSNGFIQYDFPKYFTLGKVHNELTFSKKGTKQLIVSLLQNKTIGKVFLEPHLKERLQLKDTRIRYHGCHAVRHDDHIHIQLK